MYKSILLIVFSLFLIGNASAITDEERALIQEGLEKYSDDPEKMGVLIQAVDETYDLSGEEEIRQEIVSSAESSGLGEESFANVKEGKSPEPKNTIIEDSEGETPVIEDVDDEASGGVGFIGIAIIVIVIIAIIAIVIFYLRRNKA